MKEGQEAPSHSGRVHQETAMRHTHARVLAAVASAGLLSSPATTAPLTAEQVKSSGQEGVRPVDTRPLPTYATYRGLTYGEWMARWWQEAFATWEDGADPAVSGVFGGSNRMVFLSAPVLPAGSPEVTVYATIPAGTHLFFPIITVECSVAEPPPFHGENEAELRACANGLLDLVTDPDAKIDGKAVKNPAAYRMDSPLFRYGPLTEGNVLLLPPGTQSDAVGAGYFLLLPPFSAGVHRITVRANVPDFGLAVDGEFIIKVEPTRGK
jgi:hypothetical protein